MLALSVPGEALLLSTIGSSHIPDTPSVARRRAGQSHGPLGGERARGAYDVDFVGSRAKAPPVRTARAMKPERTGPFRPFPSFREDYVPPLVAGGAGRRHGGSPQTCQRLTRNVCSGVPDPTRSQTQAPSCVVKRALTPVPLWRHEEPDRRHTHECRFRSPCAGKPPQNLLGALGPSSLSFSITIRDMGSEPPLPTLFLSNCRRNPTSL